MSKSCMMNSHHAPSRVLRLVMLYEMTVARPGVDTFTCDRCLKSLTYIISLTYI